MKRVLWLMIALVGIFSAAACGSGNSDNSAGGGTGGEVITELKISAIPDADAKKIEDRSNEFAAYLSKKIGIPVKFVPSKDYAATVTGMATGQLDMVWYGAVTSVQAEQKVEEGVTFVASRDIDLAFETYFIASKDSGIESVKDLKELKEKGKGKSFTFGSTNSTSGHVMPRWYMHDLGGFKPEEVFSGVAYSGSHDKTLDQVGSGEVDVGAMNFSTFNKASKERQNKVNKIYTTPSYVDYVWVARNGVGQDMIKKIQEAILEINKDDEEGKKILSSFGAKEKFVAADAAKWEECRKILKANILPE